MVKISKEEMIVNYRKIFFLFMTMFLVVVVTNGCAPVMKHGIQTEEREISCTYSETFHIITEPRECRVYVQDTYKGISPVEGKFTTMPVKVIEKGRYKTSYIHTIGVMSGPLTRAKRDNSTTWGYSFTPQNPYKHYIVKVFKDGYQSKEVDIIGDSNDTIFKNAIQGLPYLTEFSGKRKIFVVLEPTGVQNFQQQNNNFGQQDSDNGNAYAKAKREYNKALRNYNDALEELDSARNMRAVSNLGNSGGGLFGGLGGLSKKGKVAGLLSRVGSHGEVQEAERNLAIATERLNRARDKLQALE